MKNTPDTKALADALNADLEKAGITSTNRAGLTIPIASATLDEKYAALSESFSLLADNAKKLASSLADQKRELAAACISAQCLDLTDAAGRPIPDGANVETKITTALATGPDGNPKFSFRDLLKAYRGAVNIALSRVGISLASLPATSGPGGQQANHSATERCRAAIRNRN